MEDITYTEAISYIRNVIGFKDPITAIGVKDGALLINKGELSLWMEERADGSKFLYGEW